MQCISKTDITGAPVEHTKKTHLDAVKLGLPGHLLGPALVQRGRDDLGNLVCHRVKGRSMEGIHGYNAHPIALLDWAYVARLVLGLRVHIARLPLGPALLSIHSIFSTVLSYERTPNMHPGSEQTLQTSSISMRVNALITSHSAVHWMPLPLSEGFPPRAESAQNIVRMTMPGWICAVQSFHI